MSVENSEDRVHRARELLVELSSLFQTAGLNVRPYVSPELPVFSRHSAEDQAMLIRELEARVELYAGAVKEKIDLRDTRQLLWRALRLGGWTPSSDIFDVIDENDTVEVYSLEMKQIFRNLEFFKYISYTLEEVHGGTWYELVSRNEGVQTQLYEAAMKMVTGEVTTTMDMSFVPVHECQELKSAERRRFTIQMKALSPVFKDRTLAAVIAVNRTRFCE